MDEIRLTLIASDVSAVLDALESAAAYLHSYADKIADFELTDALRAQGTHYREIAINLAGQRSDQA